MPVQRVDDRRTRKEDPQRSQAQNSTQSPDRNLARHVQQTFDRICAELVGEHRNNQQKDADPE